MLEILLIHIMSMHTCTKPDLVSKTKNMEHVLRKSANKCHIFLMSKITILCIIMHVVCI